MLDRSMVNKLYFCGMARALEDAGLCQIDSLEGVAEKVAADTANGVGQQASPDQLQQVAQSGLTEKDIESAARVVQVLAEMKQTADQLGMQQGQQGQPGGQPMAPAQMDQTPMPPAPQPPQAGGQQKMAEALAAREQNQQILASLTMLRNKLRD